MLPRLPTLILTLLSLPPHTRLCGCSQRTANPKNLCFPLPREGEAEFESDVCDFQYTGVLLENEMRGM